MDLNKIYQGDVLGVLRQCPDESVHCVVTSPPYWGLRDYGVSGQIGLEPTPDAFASKMVEVFSEVRRVLRKDGTLWLNLGDSYAGSGKGIGSDHGKAVFSDGEICKTDWKVTKLKSKDLAGIPWMVAFALRADGWYLRSDIIWHKPNPMPESVTDRPTKAHEYIFLLTKSAKYFYDGEGIKEPAIYYEIDSRPSALVRAREFGYDTKEQKTPRPIYKDARSYDGKHSDKQRGHVRRHAGFNDRWDQMKKAEQCSAMRNKRSVWKVATHPFAEAHFATFPEALVEPCIRAGAPQGGVVLDPFMGSGTTAIVSLKLGRKFIGIELNPKYIQIAEDRIRSECGLLLTA